MEDTILIVDDSPYIVDGLVALLKRKGFNPLATHGGDEALALLATVKPDLILLDIMMEPMDGWETLDRLKANPETKDLPVLMFSAKKITPEEAQQHCLNIEDFVSKPVNPTQLLEAIKQIFARRRDVKAESQVAKDAGVDSALIEEYAALRKSIDVDTNLLCVLKKACGMNNVGRAAPAEDLAAIEKLESKIRTDEQRLKEINEKHHVRTEES
ncbi:response regulator [Methanoregula sp.]|uniref:response regulator n=1 Tax=Methanoregula sp. TaxID=2052170 RepID=UPI00236DE72B|nr:response regulator [Methanoregula sp.]MDD1685451.1 response regulator [Methanoregula sp.]